MILPIQADDHVWPVLLPIYNLRRIGRALFPCGYPYSFYEGCSPFSYPVAFCVVPSRRKRESAVLGDRAFPWRIWLEFLWTALVYIFKVATLFKVLVHKQLKKVDIPYFIPRHYLVLRHVIILILLRNNEYCSLLNYGMSS